MIFDIILTLIVFFSGFRMLMIVLSIMKSIINSRKVTKKIIEFIPRVRMTSITFSLILLLIFCFLLINRERVIPQINIMNEQIKMKLLCLIFISGIIIYTFDFMWSSFKSAVVYEEGILCYDGTLINWNEVEKINFNYFTKNKKVIIIDTDNKKEIKFFIKIEKSDEVKEIIFNKSGVISKGIIT